MTTSQPNTTSNIEDIYSLSSLQEGMLFHTLYSPAEKPYLDHIIWEIRDQQGLDVTALKRAFQQVVNRHQVLRTAFMWKIGRKPQQVVLRHLDVDIREEDWRELSLDERNARLERFLACDRAEGYDLSRPPLMRLTLMRVEATVHYFVFSYHHIIMDGWSTPIFFTELRRLYEAFSRGEALELPRPRPYRAYIDWLRQRDTAEAEAFWRLELEDFSGPTPLPNEQEGPVDSGKDYNDYFFELETSTTTELQSLARQHGLTMTTLIEGAWALLLSRYANTSDVLFGIVVSGRPYNLPGIESMVGLFTNSLPLRVKVKADQPLIGWLKYIQKKQFELRQYDWSPLPKVQSWSSVPQSTPLFESVLIFQNLPVDEALREQRPDGLNMRVFRHDPKNSFPLTIMILPGPRLLVRMLYDCRRFDDSTILRNLGHMRTVLEGMPRCLNMPICELPSLTEVEGRQALIEWNDSEAPLPSEACFHEQFEARARLAPDSIAVSIGQQWLTYGELNRRANRLTGLLLGQSLGPEAVIALYGERDPHFLIAILAVFKAGAAYLPLDPSYPKKRLLQIIELSSAALILTTETLLAEVRELLDRAPAERHPSVLVIESLLQQPRSEVNPPRRSEPGSLAYVIYTSGSTGVPKGSMIEHRGMLNHLYAKVIDLHISEEDVIGQTASQCFDISVWQFLAGLLVGGQVRILSDEIAHDPDLLLDEIERQELTIVETVPSMLRMLLEEIAMRGASRPRLASLSCLIATGEELPPDLASRWLSEYPNIPILNAYGPTECSDDVTHWFITEAPPTNAVRVPIGRPVANMRLYVTDRWLAPLPILTNGQLLVAGIGVGRGYLNDTTHTAESFIPNPFSRRPGERLYQTGDLARRLHDGQIDFLGRMDYQVKIRGYRIELGEIETLLRSHPAVRDAVVLARQNEDVIGDSRLIACLAPNPQYEEEAQERPGDNAAEAERVAAWQIIFDEVYAEDSVSAQDSSLHLRVWINSYTGQPFAEEEIFECVEDSVHRILSLHPKRVLEIGCGPGLLLFRIAPNCALYCGTDVSGVALRSLEQQLQTSRQVHSEVRLEIRSAEDFDRLDQETFDVIVLNEVVQYFPDAQYLLSVLKGAIGVVRSGGHIYVGGVRNLLLLDAFHTSVQLSQSPDSMSLEELRQRVRSQVAREKELAVAPEFFLALQECFPQITRLSVMPKGGRFLNEFTKFRYDAVLEVGGEPVSEAPCTWTTWDDERWSSESLRQWLRSNNSGRLGLAGIRNSRTHFDVKAVDYISGDGKRKTVGQLRQLLASHQANVAGLDPEQLRLLAQEFDYDIDISWSNTDKTGCYDAVFTRRATEQPNLSSQPRTRRVISRQPVDQYANTPRRHIPIINLAKTLRSHLKGSLPDYMIPSDFLILDSLPLTANGKVDRRALLALKQSDGAPPEAVKKAVTPAEALLISIWSEVLGAHVDRESNFFESGGNSLLATASIARVRKVFKVDMPLRSIFDAPTVAEFSASIDAAVKQGHGLSAPPITRAPQTSRKRLSFAQQRLWIINQMEPDTWAYNLPAAVRIDGSFQPEAFQAALNEIIRRHESLRTTFAVDGDGPTQVIASQGRINIPLVDLSGLSDAEMEAQTRHLAASEAHRTFDLQDGPLLRVCQLRWAERTNVILFTMHHIISDGWSIGVLISEVTALYNAYRSGKPSSLVELAIQYADFAHWQREWLQGETLDKQLSYWKGQLAGAPSSIKLSLDRPRPRLSASRGRSYSFRAGLDTTRTIESLCRKEGMTPFIAVFAAFNVFLYRLTGQTDIVVGADVANRNWREVEDLIGFFVNLLALRTKLSGHSTFREVLAYVREAALGAYAHQDLPFDLLTKELRLERALNDNRIFDVLFVFQNFAVGRLEMFDAELALIPIDYETARFDLALFVEETSHGLTGRWTYRTDLFEDGAIAQLSARFMRLLESILERPDASLDELDMLDPLERTEQDSLQKLSLNKFKSLRPKTGAAPS